jgi:hypothetical protein
MVVLVLAAPAVAKHAHHHARFQLVGFTASTHQGDAGVLTFTRACQEEFGPGARMCRVDEALETVVVPEDLEFGPSTDDAWARPEFDPTTDVNCRGWAQLFRGQFPLHGTTINRLCQRSIFLECREEISVACCALVEDPKPRRGDD